MHNEEEKRDKGRDPINRCANKMSSSQKTKYKCPVKICKDTQPH